MKTIPLTQGRAALVDDADWQRLSSHRWCATRSADGRRFYAVRRTQGRIVWMHREIMGDPAGRDVDHRDGDGLNNRRDNLRVATRRQNAQNQRRPRAHKSSRFKGVSACKNTQLWRATIRVDGRRVHLGYFQHEHEAAAAYDTAALDAFGEFAAVNGQMKSVQNTQKAEQS